MLYNIYFSPTGGTKKVADILAGNLGGEVCKVDICCDIEKMTLQAEVVCLVSVPSFAGRVPQIAVERIKKDFRQWGESDFELRLWQSGMG